MTSDGPACDPAGHAASAESLVLVTALRRLLRAESPDDVAAAVKDAVIDIGGAVAPVASNPADSFPVDISFGLGDPLLPVATGQAAATLQRILPNLVEDARVAFARTNREAYLEVSATSDPLTGLANRRVTMRVLGRLGVGDTVVFVDLDRFKEVNDTLGHAAGDEVLRVFARSLRAVARASDTVGRFGGEEFVLLLPMTSADGAVILVRRLRDLWAMARPQPVTFSAGIAVVGAGGSRAALSEADRALYRAKQGGRDRIEVAG